MSDDGPSPKSVLDQALESYPWLADRLARQLLNVLHALGFVTAESVYREVRGEVGGAPVEAEPDPNRPSAVPAEAVERQAFREIVFHQAVSLLTAAQLQSAVDGLRRREEAETLEGLAVLPDVSFELLAAEVRRFCRMPRGDMSVPAAQVQGIRVSLIRNFISDQLEFIGVAKNFLRIVDFGWIVDRTIGPDSGQGRIGGKAAGMFLGHRILQGAQLEHTGDPTSEVHLPESWFLRSDVIERFLRINRLEEYQSQKYKDPEEIRNDYPVIRQVFQDATFPPEIAVKLERLLDEIGEHPVIVRSSSLLEDRFGAAFSGMYASIFLANRGPKRDRLKALVGAIAEVYASTLAPNPLLYRRRHNLVDYNEDMAILIQKVVGSDHGRFFFPDFAGVAFSRNEYRWSPRIRAEDGMARIVFGLGTRAVDRTANDHSRLVALGAPMLRTEVTPDQIARYSQRFVDVIDHDAGCFRTVPFGDVLAEGEDAPGLEHAASIRSADALVEPAGGLHGIEASRLVLTFDRLLGRTRFATIMRDRLRRLEDAYGVPVNVEFAEVDGKFYLLQCRPLVQAPEAAGCRLPSGVPIERCLFRTRGLVRSGEIRDLSHAVFVDPRAYDDLGSPEDRARIGRAVARINDALEGEAFALLGPGRWGSNDSRLGVKVTYADINHCAVLIEVAYRKGDYVPEVSYGTHFFQDLVEDGIYYLAIHPGEDGVHFDDAFFTRNRNVLGEISPRDTALAGCIRVVRLSEAAPGRAMRLVMDGDAGEALCWLE